MRRFLREYCFCWFGRPAGSGDIRALIENKDQSFDAIEDKSYEREEMAEHMIDTSDWQSKDIAELTPYKIKDTDLTKEYINIPEDQKEQKLKELGYELGDDIGKGAYGRVRIAYKIGSNGVSDKSLGKEMAAKVMELTRLRFGPKDKRRMALFKNELFILVKSKHKNIVGIKDHFIVNNQCYLIMEYANGGNMITDVKKYGPYKEREAMAYFAQVSSAIYYLHCRLGIAHLDLKLANFLIFGGNEYINRTIKVTDFGLSRLRIDEKKGVMKEKDPIGTLPYMSPQVLRLYVLERLDEESVFGRVKPFNPFIADIWSLGVCLFLMLFRGFPFQIEEDIRLLRHVLDAQRNKNYNYSVKDAKNLSIGCKDMLEDCLEPNPHKRLTIQNIVCHYWFEKYYSIEDLSGSSP